MVTFQFLRMIGFAGCVVLGANVSSANAQLTPIRGSSPPPTFIPTTAARQSATPYNPPPVSPILNRPNYNLGGYYGGYFPYYVPFYGSYDQGSGYNSINYNYTYNYNFPEGYVPPRNFATPNGVVNDYPTIARLSLQVPLGAEVTVNGRKFDIGTSRTFESPDLKPNESYTFDVKVTWMENGKPVVEKRSLSVKAGDIQGLQYMALPPAALKVQR